MLGKIEGKRRQGQQKLKWLVMDSMDMNLRNLWEKTGVPQFMVTENCTHFTLYNDKTTVKDFKVYFIF